MMMAKKKKGKDPGASKDIDAWESDGAAGGDGEEEDDGLTPVSGVAKQKKAKAPKKSNLSPAALAALKALDAMEAAAGGGGDDDPLAPLAPAMGKKKLRRKDLLAEQQAPASAWAPPGSEPPASPVAPAGPTLAQKVRAACEQLGVDASLPVAAALKACNEALGIEAAGALMSQADELVAQLGLAFDDPAPAAAAPAREPVAAASVAPEEGAAVVSGAADEAAVVVEEQEEETVAERAPDAAGGAEGQPAGEVLLSKKKQGKPKAEAGDEAEARGAGTDQSGRRGMGTRIQRFDDAEPGFAYVKMDGGKLRFRNQDVSHDASSPAHLYVLVARVTCPRAATTCHLVCPRAATTLGPLAPPSPARPPVSSQVLVDATWDVQTGQRVGLVGNNGAGKTTQLKILAGELELDGGEVVKSGSDIKVIYIYIYTVSVSISISISIYLSIYIYIYLYIYIYIYTYIYIYSIILVHSKHTYCRLQNIMPCNGEGMVNSTGA